jgi:hypothetical protein
MPEGSAQGKNSMHGLDSMQLSFQVPSTSEFLGGKL